MAKSSTLSEYLGTMLEKIVVDAIGKALVEKQHEHDAAIKKLTDELRAMTQRATVAEARIAAVNKALGFMPQKASPSGLLAVVEAEPERAANEPNEVVVDDGSSKVQPSVAGVHLSAEQKVLRSDVIRRFHERRKKTGVAVTTLADELGVSPASCYDLYHRWCKEEGVPRALPARGRRNRNNR